MTITADTRRSASTAAGPPTSSHLPDDASRTEVVSQYGITPTAPGDPDDGKPDSGAETAAPGGSEPTAADPAAHKPNPPHRRLPPAPVRARVVAGVIDLVIGSLLVGGLTTVIWQVGGRPPLTSGLIAFGVIVGARWLAIAATGWAPGGWLLKVRLLSAQHQAPSPLGSFLHADLILAVSVTTFGLGTIALMRTAATDPEGRGWHDKLSGMALLHARKSSRPGQVATRATAPETRSADSPAVADAVGESRRHTAPHSAQTTTAPVAAPASDGAEDAERSDTEAPSASQPSHGTDQSDAPRSRRRRSQRAEKRSPASGSHTDSASTETRTRAPRHPPHSAPQQRRRHRPDPPAERDRRRPPIPPPPCNRLSTSPHRQGRPRRWSPHQHSHRRWKPTQPPSMQWRTTRPNTMRPPAGPKRSRPAGIQPHSPTPTVPAQRGRPQRNPLKLQPIPSPPRPLPRKMRHPRHKSRARKPQNP